MTMISPSDVSAICSAVPMRRAAEFYGFKPDKSGFICCPFHSEDTPSFKIYDNNRGWNCFGCNTWGSVIDFVRRLYNLNFTAACQKLNDDFAIGLHIDGKREYFTERKARGKLRLERIRREEREKWQRSTMRALCAIHREMRKAMRSGDADNPLFFAALQNIDMVNYFIESLENDPDDFKTHCGREVERWTNMIGLNN